METISTINNCTSSRPLITLKEIKNTKLLNMVCKVIFFLDIKHFFFTPFKSVSCLFFMVKKICYHIFTHCHYISLSLIWPHIRFFSYTIIRLQIL